MFDEVGRPSRRLILAFAGLCAALGVPAFAQSCDAGALVQVADSQSRDQVPPIRLCDQSNASSDARSLVSRLNAAASKSPAAAQTVRSFATQLARVTSLLSPVDSPRLVASLTGRLSRADLADEAAFLREVDALGAGMSAVATRANSIAAYAAQTALTPLVSLDFGSATRLIDGVVNRLSVYAADDGMLAMVRDDVETWWSKFRELNGPRLCPVGNDRASAIYERAQMAEKRNDRAIAGEMYRQAQFALTIATAQVGNWANHLKMAKNSFASSRRFALDHRQSIETRDSRRPLTERQRALLEQGNEAFAEAEKAYSDGRHVLAEYRMRVAVKRLEVARGESSAHHYRAEFDEPKPFDTTAISQEPCGPAAAALALR